MHWEKDFAAAAAFRFAMESPSIQSRLFKVQVTLKKAQDAVTPVIRDLPFADATASRRFLNRFETALAAMKGNGSTVLVNPAWTTEGTSVADLVKYMARNKVLFGAVNPGGETAYLALHKGLATYLFALTQAKK